LAVHVQAVDGVLQIERQKVRSFEFVFAVAYPNIGPEIISGLQGVALILDINRFVLRARLL